MRTFGNLFFDSCHLPWQQRNILSTCLLRWEQVWSKLLLYVFVRGSSRWLCHDARFAHDIPIITYKGNSLQSLRASHLSAHTKIAGVRPSRGGGAYGSHAETYDLLQLDFILTIKSFLRIFIGTHLGLLASLWVTSSCSTNTLPLWNPEFHICHHKFRYCAQSWARWVELKPSNLFL